MGVRPFSHFWTQGFFSRNSVDQIGLKLRYLPVSASLVQGLKACATATIAQLMGNILLISLGD